MEARKMSEENMPEAASLVEAIRRNAKMAVITGVILVIAGFLAMVSPFVAGLSVTIMVGALLAISGISQCFLAFKAGAFGRALMIFLGGLIMAVAGFYMISQPVAGLAALTLILAAYFIASGILEIIVAFQLRPADGWGFELFGGIVTLVLGFLLWRQFPLSGAWAIGILFGIKMVFSGWALIFVGRSVKKVTTAAEAS
jgi:uncharacterized membrane protein HdeD (DUF308 family)